MKEYEQAKILLMSEPSTPTTGYIAKWATLSVQSKDTTLQYYATEFARVLKLKPPFTKKYGYSSYTSPVTVYNTQFQNIKEWFVIHRQIVSEITEYVDACIAHGVPSWQLMAMKHGWIPPTN